jgi:hypothetical protein
MIHMHILTYRSWNKIPLYRYTATNDPFWLYEAIPNIKAE